VILLPALRNIYPSLASQIILILLGSSLASQVSADELFHTAAFVESRTYRSFEVYAVVCAIYFVMVLSLRLIFAGVERIAFRWPTRR
jgi:polar amino acid transport system permease protein